VCAGLANRLRATVSGICAAEAIGTPVKISWPREAVFGATFTDLFELPVAGASFDDTFLQGAKMCLSEADWDGRTGLRLKSYGCFYRKDPQRWLECLRSLKPRAEFLPRLPPNTVGVHIRRTDNARSIKDSPTEAFFRAMDAYNAATTFFLATDSTAERAAVLARYPGRVVTIPTECYHRDLLKGIQEAFREFLGLAACAEILGSAGSSFSEMAAAYGDRPLLVVTSAMCLHRYGRLTQEPLPMGRGS